MNVFFLGTGAAEGVPALFCNCAVCAFARAHGGRDKRFRTGILVDNTVRVDLSPDALAQVHAYPDLPLCDLKHLLFTHSHDDHFAVRELQYLSPNFAPERDAPLKIWGTDYCMQHIRVTMGRFFEPVPLKMGVVTPFETSAVAHLHVTPVLARHKVDEPCLNYLFTEPATQKTLLYASDTGWYAEETWAFLRGRRMDAAIVECGLGIAESGYEGHLSLDECARFRQKLIADDCLSPDAPFYLTHISHRGGLNHQAMNERAAPLGMTVAYDGLQITI
ncbi:MAG: hypothetical protein H7Y38_12210 [Armatimonadetes bacterium]|nr:hypothetical protein [Armatimonadota bacterium]